MNVYGLMRDSAAQYLDVGGSPVRDTAQAKERIKVIKKYGFRYFQMTGSKSHDIYMYVQAGARIVGTVRTKAPEDVYLNRNPRKAEALLFKVG